MPVHGGSMQRFNGPMTADSGYRGAQYGYQPTHVGSFPQPGVPPPADSRECSQYAVGSASQFVPTNDGGSGQQFPDSRQTVPASFQYPGPHPASVQPGSPQTNTGNSSTLSKTSAPMPPELPDPSGSQSKSRQEDQNLPPKSSSQTTAIGGRLQSTNGSGTIQSSAATNGTAEQFSRTDSLSEGETQSGDVTTSSPGNVASVENSSRSSVPSTIPAFPSNAHQGPNVDAVHGRSSDVVAMEGMPSRYGVGPEDMIDGRYPVNGRDGYVGRMGHPVPVEGTFRHGFQRQMEPYDRPTYGPQAGMMPPHFQHPGYFNHPNYQIHQHTHSSHGPSYHSQVRVVNI